MSTVTANGIDIYYELWGQGPPLVMAHGFCGCTDEWRALVLPLAKKHRLLLYDVRGHGRSSAPEDPALYSMPIFAADQAALMRALGIERAHVGGGSMGGMIAAQFAIDYPQMVSSLLLCDTTCGNGSDAGPAGQFERFLVEAFAQMEEIAVKDGFQELARRELEWSRENDPYFDERPEPEEVGLRRLERMTLAGYVGANRAIRQRPDLLARLDEIRAPTLILVGEWDGFLPCSLLADERIAGSRLALIERSPHGTPTWRPEAFRKAILNFLDDVEAGRPVAGSLRYQG
jgi:pimeloyl-ACP methyl ester carboxylesterase